MRAEAQAVWLPVAKSQARRLPVAMMASSVASASGPMIEAERLGSSEISSMPGWMYLVTCLTLAKPPQAQIFSMLCGW